MRWAAGDAMRAAVLIPTLDEAAGIGTLLRQLSRQPADCVAAIIVADGGSGDGTQAIVRAWADRDRRIVLIDNPDRIQAAGINRAAAAVPATVPLLVRIDAHARYPDDYVPRIAAAAERTGADLVATRLYTVGETCWQRAVAAASNSIGGNGGSAHRHGGRSAYVDHGHHAGISTRLFHTLGGYDIRWATNEDAEFDVRVRRAGGRIWLAGDIVADYLPRASAAALARQYYRYGCGRAQTWQAHREPLRLRQLMPPLLVLGLAAAILLAPVAPVLLLLPSAYLALLAALTAMLLRRRPERCTLLAGSAMAIMHLAWGWGFLASSVRGRRFDSAAKALLPQTCPVEERRA